MGSEQQLDPLIADLRRLGQSVPVGVDPMLVDAVMARLGPAPIPPPAPGPLRRLMDLQRVMDAVTRRRRRILVVVVVLLLGLLGVPPVRAAVVDWFTFDGVQVHLEPTRPPSTIRPSPPPTVAGRMSMRQAGRLVSFEPLVLTALGPPQGIEVSDDRRMLSMSWTGSDGRAIRLDQFDGQLDYFFAKTAPGVQFTAVAGQSALWFDQPHDVVVIDASGQPRTETARLAGHTLIWEQGGTVLRLEGDFTLDQAVAIAASASASASADPTS